MEAKHLLEFFAEDAASFSSRLRGDFVTKAEPEPTLGFLLRGSTSHQNMAGL